MTELAGLHARFTGDSSDLKAAATGAIGLLDQYGRALTRTVSAEDQAKAASGRLAREYEKVRMSTDSAYSASTRYAAALTTVQQMAISANWSSEQLAAETTRLAAHFGVAEAAGENFTRAMRSSRFHTANLAAQFNDIGVMMAAGQNPLMMAVQQGTQVSQVLNVMGGTARQQLGALGRSLLSVVNPTALVTIGVIAGTAALVQWAFSSDDAADAATSFDEAMGSLSSAIADVNTISGFYANDGGAAIEEAYGRQTDAIQAQIVAMDELAQRLAIRELAQPLRGVVDELTGFLTTTTMALQRLFSINIGQANQLSAALERVYAANDVESSIAAYESLAAYILRVTGGVENMTAAQEEFYSKVRESLDQAYRLRSALDRPGWFSRAMAEGEELLTLFQRLIDRQQELFDAGLTDSAGNATGFGSGNRARSAPPRAPNDGENDPASRRGRTDPLPAELERLQNELATALELEMASFEERQELLEQALERRLITQKEYNDLLEGAQAAHSDALRAIDVYRYGSTLDIAKQFFGDMSGALQGGNEEMLRISKVFGAAQALISAWQGAAEALKLPFPGNLAAFAQVLATGFGAVSAIQSATAGGGGGGSAGSTAAAAAATQSQGPLQVSLNTFGVGDLISRADLSGLLDSLNAAAGDRGYNILRPA
jgi:hypothetical protein